MKRELLTMLVFLLVVPLVLGENAILYVQTSNDDSGQITLDHISTYTENIFYQERYEDFFESYGIGIVMKMYDADGAFLGEEDAWGQAAFFYDDRLSKILLEGEDKLSHEQDISFCNNNGICEPCEGVNCVLAEGYLTCDDCASGAKDNYCDLKRDGICDPDCNDLDVDCNACQITNTCLGEYEIIKRTCSDYGGSPCGEGQCLGELVLTEDVFNDCCVGVCEIEEIIDDEVRDAGWEGELGDEYVVKVEAGEIIAEEPTYFEPPEEQKQTSFVDYLKADIRISILAGFILLCILVMSFLHFGTGNHIEQALLHEAEILIQRGYQVETVRTYLVTRGYKKKDVDFIMKRFQK